MKSGLREVWRRRQDFVPPDDLGGGVGGQVVSGSVWSGISVGAQTLLQFVRSIIFARLLMPEDFGIFSLANVMTQFILIFANFGFNSSIIYHRDLTRRDLATCWWGNLGVDGAAALICIAVALTTSRFTESDQVPYVVCLLALQFLIVSAGSVNAALMRRLFMFKETAVVAVAGAVVAFAAAWVAVRFLLWGVYGLVFGMIASSVVMSLLNFVYLPWLPSRTFARATLRKHLKYGSWFLGVNLITYANGNLDKASIGAFLNNTQLGFYEYAGNIPLLVVMKLAQVLNSVLFPAFSNLQNRLDELGRILRQVFFYNALIIFPLLIGLGMVAPDFVLAAYGPKWLPILDPLRIFCVFGLIRIFTNPLFALCNGVGRPEFPFKWSLILLPVNAALTYLGVKHFGITGAVLARLAVPVFMWLTLGREILKHVGVSRLAILGATLPALGAGALMAGAVWAVQAALGGHVASPVARLAICVPVGAVTYCGVVVLFWRGQLQEARDMLRGKPGR